jgi:hypothetical protein
MRVFLHCQITHTVLCVYFSHPHIHTQSQTQAHGDMPAHTVRHIDWDVGEGSADAQWCGPRVPDTLLSSYVEGDVNAHDAPVVQDRIVSSSVAQAMPDWCYAPFEYAQHKLQEEMPILHDEV